MVREKERVRERKMERKRGGQILNKKEKETKEVVEIRGRNETLL